MRIRVLLIEDNLVNQKVVLAMLKSEGYQADVASDGAQGLKMLAEKRYDAIFLDVHMPGMGGLDVSREINERWSDDRPWIIALTADGSPSHRDACLMAGMDDYLSKPLSIDTLVGALRDVTPRTPRPGG